MSPIISNIIILNVLDQFNSFVHKFLLELLNVLILYLKNINLNDSILLEQLLNIVTIYRYVRSLLC